MPRELALNRNDRRVENEPWDQWWISAPASAPEALDQERYAERVAYWEDGGKSKQVLYYEEGDGWRLHWWDSKGEGPEDGEDWNRMVFKYSFPMDFSANKKDVSTAVKEFTTRTEPSHHFPAVLQTVPPWEDGYRSSLSGKEADVLKGPPPESYP